MILRAIMGRLAAPPSENSLATLAAPATSSATLKSSLSSEEDYFFGFCALSVCLTTNAFMRANSFWNPFVKSCVPYSKRTTKQKVKKTNKANQNSPRIKAMGGRLIQLNCSVNAAYCRENFRLNQEAKLPCFLHHARADA